MQEMIEGQIIQPGDIVQEGRDAWNQEKQEGKKSRERWLKIANALDVGRQLFITKSGGLNKKGFGQWCETEGFSDIPHNFRADALWLLDNSNVILYHNRFDSIAHPTAIRAAYRKLTDKPNGSDNNNEDDADDESDKKNKPHVSNNSGENEWYTPAKYIESARLVMDGIDTDPASNLLANQTVKANVYYTRDDDGLGKEWFGNVWLNPPYAQPLITEFSDALVNKYKNSEFDQACVLVNNATDTNWLQNMLVLCDSVCFIKTRVKFIDKEGNPSGAPLQGQVILYFGRNIESFKREFSQYGTIMIRA